MVMMLSFRSRLGGRRNLIILLKKDCVRLEDPAGQARLATGQVVISFLRMTLKIVVFRSFDIFIMLV